MYQCQRHVCVSDTRAVHSNTVVYFFKFILCSKTLPIEYWPKPWLILKLYWLLTQVLFILDVLWHTSSLMSCHLKKNSNNGLHGFVTKPWESSVRSLTTTGYRYFHNYLESWRSIVEVRRIRRKKKILNKQF